MLRFIARFFGNAGGETEGKSSQTLTDAASSPPPVCASLKPTAAKARVVWRDGSFPMEAVGESNYQCALASICGGHNRYGNELLCEAEIVREPLNPHDGKAVAVLIGGAKVGYLPREQAARVSAQMVQDGVSSARCGAKIVGGWRTNQYDVGHFGVRLAIPNWGWIDFGIGAAPPTRGEGASPWSKRPTPIRPKTVPDGPLSGHSVAILGATTDGELAQELASAGAKIMARIGKTTTLLVVVDDRPFSPGVKNSATYLQAEKLIAEGKPLRIVSKVEARAMIT